MKRILVPVDGSACSIRALRYAAQRQRESAATEILVLNVQPSIRPSRTLTRSLIDEHQQRGAEAALKPALAVIKRLELAVPCHIAIGEPARTIVAFAQKKQCAEIAMGNNGFGAIAGLVLGSVARKVVYLAKTPVILVK